MTVKDLRVLIENFDEYIHVPDGIERLKKTILHMAVSGQLVPQDPSEGTGEELYQQIQAEKQKLIADGNLKKQKPPTKINEEEKPYILPHSWKWVRLDNIVELITDGTHHTPKYQNLGVPFLSIKDISAGKLDFSNCKYISEKEHLAINNRCNPEQGDILFCRIGTLGRPVIVDTAEYFSIFVSVGLIKFNQDLILPKYLKMYLEAPVTYKQYLKIMAGGSHTNKLNLVSMRGLVAAIPPTSEQRRIVEKVDRILNLIDTLSEKYRAEQSERKKLVASSFSSLGKKQNKIALEKLTEIIKTKEDAVELRKTIFHLAVTGQLVPQDPSEGTGEELYQQIQAEKQNLIAGGKLKRQKILAEITDNETPHEIPKHWKWVRLGDVSEIFSGNSINTSEKKLKYEKIIDGYPYLGTKDIGYGFEKIDYDNGVKVPYSEDNFRIITQGTVLICSEGGSAGKKCGIVNRNVSFGNKMYAFKAYGNNILPTYVLYYYLTHSFYEQFRSKVTGIIGGISVANFKELIIPLPPVAEQARIVQKTDQFLNLITKLEQSLEK